MSEVSLDDAVLARQSFAADLFDELASGTDFAFTVGKFFTDVDIRAGFTDGVGALGIPAMDIASGASHDAAAFSAAGVPRAMVFTRNANGSHDPDETMAIPDFMQATRLLTWWIDNRA